jgi:DNA-binding CsgD family transcriptional regulator
VKKTVLIYGLVGGALIAALKVVEYRYLVVRHSVEIYGGIVALLFASLGIWLGLRLTRANVAVRAVPVPSPADAPFAVNARRQAELGITPRELEILREMAAGLSNKEIAAKLFVSENTVKTHAASVFDKLAARRRTHAVQIAKEAQLIP